MFNRKYDFIAIDCEKASNEPASLCSIGIACFKNGRVKATKEYIVRPYPFVFYAGSIVDGAYHGVPVEVYENAPTINQIWPKLKKFLDKNIIVGHGINGDLQLIQIALEHFGVIFKGYIKLDKRDVYLFYLQSDDGSVLFVDGQAVALNDGSHSTATAEGKIALDAGFHEIEVRYMEDTDWQELTVGIQGGDIKRMSYLNEILYTK